MYAQKKTVENIHIVRERDRRRLRELVALAVIGFIVGGFLVLFTSQNLEVIRLGREATRLQQMRKEIDNRNKVLQLELDRLTSLDAVERKARKLGFETTDPKDIVTVTDGTSSGLRPPSPGERREGPQLVGEAGVRGR